MIRLTLRERHDAIRRRWGVRCNQPGHPIRAVVTVVTQGRTSLGRPALRTFVLGLDLLHGQSTEGHLLREIQDAVEATYLADLDVAQRSAELDALETKRLAQDAEHTAWEASRRSELTFTAERPLKAKRRPIGKKKGAGR